MLKLKLAVMWLQIRALETGAQGMQDTLALVCDADTRHRMQMRYIVTLAEITRLKADYRRIKRGNGIRAACLGVA